MGSFSGVGKIVNIDIRITRTQYVTILIENLKESARKINMVFFLFQLDYDPKHTFRLAKQCFTKNHIEICELRAQSPDCSPIQYFWSILDAKIPLSLRQNVNIFLDDLQKQ